MLGGGQVDVVAHRFDFRREVPQVFLARRGLERDPLMNSRAVAFELIDLVGVVGEQAYRTHAEVIEYRSADAVVPRIGLVADGQVGLDGIHARVLQLVRPQFVDQTDPASLLTEIEQHAVSGFLDEPPGLPELLAAVASKGSEQVPGNAFGVQAHQDPVFILNFTNDQGEVLVGAARGMEDDQLRRSELGRQECLGFLFNQGQRRGQGGFLYESEFIVSWWTLSVGCFGSPVPRYGFLTVKHPPEFRPQGADMELIRIILLVIIPPLGVFLKVGIGVHFWLNLLLTLLAYFPGLVHAIWVVTQK